MTLEGQLLQLGLKENEVSVYIAALELGEPGVGDIEKKTGLHKQLIYIAASSLESRGLLTTQEIRGRKRFSITNPAALEELAKEQLRQAQSIVPQLYERANRKRSEDKVRTYRGNKGIQQYYIDSVRHQPQKSQIYILGVNSERYFEIFNQEELPYQRFETIRKEQGVKLNLLLFGAKETELTINKHRPNVELRVLSESVQSPMDIMIWQNHVGMLFYANEPYILDIIGEDTSQGFQEYFSVLWNQANLH